MSELLELGQLAQDDRVSEVDVGGRWVDAELGAQRPPFRARLHQTVQQVTVGERVDGARDEILVLLGEILGDVDAGHVCGLLVEAPDVRSLVHAALACSPGGARRGLGGRESTICPPGRRRGARVGPLRPSTCTIGGADQPRSTFLQGRPMPSSQRQSTPRRRSRGLRVLRVLALVTLLGVVAALSLAGGLYVALARNLPELDTSSAATAAQTTKIFDNAATPTLLAQLHGTENRVIVGGDRIPQAMRDAVVAVEDRRFYVHQGVDFIGIMRAVVEDLRHRSFVQGGSTITQQYIKNAYITDERTLNRKIKEATLAYQLEKQWSKEKILDEYLNTIYFGDGAYGVEAAAQTYFGISAKQLTIPQAALLAAIPKSPTAYSPRRDQVAALGRRNLILNDMFAQGYLTGDQLQSALATPITLAAPRTNEPGMVPYWVEMVREQLVAKYGSNTVLKGGLRVFTSIDLAKQKTGREGRRVGARPAG